MTIAPELAKLIRDMQAQLKLQSIQVKELQSVIRPISPEDFVNSIPGRRIMYSLVGQQTFTVSDAGRRAASINMLVSQDGPFIMTHFPVVMWLPSAPSTATNFGQWSPTTRWPLPAQATAVANLDVVSLSWEIQAGGSNRNFQSAAMPPMFSLPGQSCPLPVPTLFYPNDTVQFTPTYEGILFGASAATPTTGGTLRVMIPGYRVVSQ